MIEADSFRQVSKRAVRAALPAVVRRGVRQLHQQLVFRKAVRQLRRQQDWSASALRDVAQRVLYGWGNEGWAANEDYAAAVMSDAHAARGAVLECGSGATTVLLGLIAERTGNEVWTLEHLPEWAEQVRRTLRRHGIGTVQVVDAPLRDYGHYEWYDLGRAHLPDGFSLVVCDGPPSLVKGGRFGLVPQMRERLTRPSVILLDDLCRPSERDVLEQWRSLLRFQAERSSTRIPFERLRVEADADVSGR